MSDLHEIVGAGVAYKKSENKWKYNSSTFNSPKKLLNHNPDIKIKDTYHDSDRKMNEIEEKWALLTITEWVQSGFKHSTTYVQSAVWSWWKGQWIDYDINTNKFIENKYQEYINSAEEFEIYGIKLLETGLFGKGKKLYDPYRIYFNAPHISLNPESIQSRSHPKWKNDEDTRNAYFLQENYKTMKYRIVRRRKLMMD